MGCWESPTGHHVFILCWVSLICTMIAAIGGIAAYYKLDSSLILVYGLENLVDFISSAIVLWRFYLPSSSDPAEEARLLAREKRASVGITFVLVVLGFGTIITASEDFAMGMEELKNLTTLYYVSMFSMLIFGLLAMFKFQYAKAMNSPSLRKDGLCSAFGTVLAASLFLTAVLSKSSNGGLWWLDPLIAMTCGIATFIYGLRGIYKAYVRDGLPVCSCSWWMYGDKSDASEMEMTGPTSPSPTKMARGDEEDVSDVVIT